MTPTVQIIHGDCLEQMRTLADASVHSIVTDPPYGIRFMGKAWDGADIDEKTAARQRQAHDPSKKVGDNGGHRSIAAEAGKYRRSPEASIAFEEFSADWAAEALRVLCPGGHLVSFASTRTYHRMVCGIEDAGFEIRDQLAWVFGSGFPKSHNLAGQWGGWGTALKPAWEPIVLARKPLKGTVDQNVKRHGTGALNIGATRVGSNSSGRWPANLVHDGSEEVTAQFPAEAGAAAPVTGEEPSTLSLGEHGIYSPMKRQAGQFYGDTGSASRFFYCAKSSVEDREAGLQEEAIAEKLFGMSGGATQALKDGKTEYQNDGIGLNKITSRRNTHPTVKPTDLMRWLCRLVTPGGGVILDPFMGSGSTGRGAVIEGFNFIGIEKEAEYLPIARARIRDAQGPLFAS